MVVCGTPPRWNTQFACLHSFFFVFVFQAASSARERSINTRALHWWLCPRRATYIATFLVCGRRQLLLSLIAAPRDEAHAVLARQQGFLRFLHFA
jgi:hypothetical protein